MDWLKINLGASFRRYTMDTDILAWHKFDSRCISESGISFINFFELRKALEKLIAVQQLTLHRNTKEKKRKKNLTVTQRRSYSNINIYSKHEYLFRYTRITSHPNNIVVTSQKSLCKSEFHELPEIQYNWK